MKRTETLAIKYLIVGFGVGILNFLIIQFTPVILFRLEVDNVLEISNSIYNSIDYLSNAIVGLFILIDSFRFLKNKIVTSVLGFCLPIFGICFLLIENYLIEKTT